MRLWCDSQPTASAQLTFRSLLWLSQLPYHQSRRVFGGKPAAEDEAAALWAPWAATRTATALPDAPPEWAMRQALFASQARLLLKLHRHAEVADRGLKFVQSFGGALAQQQKAGSLPPLLREAWAFASCISLAAATSRQQVARAEEKRRTDHGGSRSTRWVQGVLQTGAARYAAFPWGPHVATCASMA